MPKLILSLFGGEGVCGKSLQSPIHECNKLLENIHIRLDGPKYTLSLSLSLSLSFEGYDGKNKRSKPHRQSTVDMMISTMISTMMEVVALVLRQYLSHSSFRQYL